MCEKIPPQEIKNILKLESVQEIQVADLRKSAVIGSFEHIKRMIVQEYLGEGFAQMASALKEKGGAFAHPRHNRVFIDSEIWPENHAQAILEHEVIERIFGDNQRLAKEKLDRLGLTAELEKYYKITPNYAHYLAVVHELVKAKALGILAAHLALHQQIAQQVNISAGRRKFDQEFREKVAEILTSNDART